MALLQNDLRLFGIDLTHLGRDLGRVVDGVRQSPLLSWITPQPLVRLRQADGSFSVWQMGDPPTIRPGLDADAARFSAVELPSDLYLQREFVLPSLTDDQVRAAAALDVQSNSPFSPADVVWGHGCMPCANGQLRVVTVMASRQQLEQHLQSLSPQVSAATTELWALPSRHERPILLTGFGEQQRLKQVASGQRWGVGLLCLASLLVAAIALTPTVQLHLRAQQARQIHAELVQRASAAVSKREALLNSIEQLKAVSDELVARIDPFRLIEALTQVLPDDTSVHNLKLKANKVTISGVTADASSLMQLLSAVPGLREVRAPSAATRMAGAQRESFVIEFSLDPELFAVQTPPKDPAPSAPIAPAAAPSAAEAASTPATIPAPAAPMPGTGGAVFGGSSTRPAPAPNPVSAKGQP